MKKLLALGIVLFMLRGAVLTGGAAETTGIDSDKAVVVLVVESTVVTPYAPFHAWVELRNPYDKEISVTVGVARIGYRFSPTEKWKGYSQFGAAYGKPHLPIPLMLDPYEIKRWPVILDLMDTEDGYSFFMKGNTKIYLKAIVYELESPEMVLETAVVAAKDRLALEEIKRNPILVSCFDEHILWINEYNNPQALAACRKFMETHPGTLYGAYAVLGLALLDSKGKDLAKRATAINRLRELGKTGPGVLRQRALWYAASAAGGTETETGRELLAAAQKTKGDPYFDALIMLEARREGLLEKGIGKP